MAEGRLDGIIAGTIWICLDAFWLWHRFIKRYLVMDYFKGKACSSWITL